MSRLVNFARILKLILKNIVLVMLTLVFLGIVLFVLYNGVNFNTSLLSALVFFSILGTIWLHKTVETNANILKTTVSSYMIGVPAQELYSSEFMSYSSWGNLKTFAVISICVTLISFALWGYASYVECRNKNSPASIPSVCLGSFYVAIAYAIVGYRAILKQIGVML